MIQTTISTSTTVRHVATVLMSFAVCACAACGSFQPRPGTAVPEYSPRTLTAAEIQQVDARTALDAIQLLRPEFLTWTRGAESGFGHVRVYVDHVPGHGLEDLVRIPAVTVKSVKLLRSYEATFEYGTDNNAGALEILTQAPGSEAVR